MTDDSTSRDVRFALRSFRHAPLTALTIVGTVAVGLGVVAVLFTVLNSFVFRVDAVPAVNEMSGVVNSGSLTPWNVCNLSLGTTARRWSVAFCIRQRRGD